MESRSSWILRPFMLHLSPTIDSVAEDRQIGASSLYKMRYLRWKLLYWLFRVRVSVEKVTKRSETGERI